MMMSAVIGDADIEVRAAVIGGWRVVVARVTNEQQPHAAAGLYGDDRVTRTDPTASPADGTRTTFGNGDAVAYRGMETTSR